MLFLFLLNNIVSPVSEGKNVDLKLPGHSMGRDIMPGAIMGRRVTNVC